MKLSCVFCGKGIGGGVLLLAGAAAAPAQTVHDPSLVVQNVITSGAPAPGATTFVFLAPDDILIARKQTGQVHRVIQGASQGSPVLDLPVNHASTRGLLGLAVDPLFADNRRVYVFYTRSSTGADTNALDAVAHHRISRFTWNGTALVGEEVLVALSVDPGPNFNGGVLVFGPPDAPPAEQKLFAVVGSMSRRNQTQNFSPAEGGAPPDDSGSVIRINPDGTVPGGADRGPFYDVAGSNVSLQRLYGYGIRNSFGLAFDPHPTLGGALWDTENGDFEYDEINRIDPAYNGGWEDQQGPTGFPNVDEAAAGKLTFGGVGAYSDPEFSWRQTVGLSAIHFLSGAGLGAGYQYDCFVAAVNTGRIYRFELNAQRTGFLLTGGLADTVFDLAQESPDTDASIHFGSDFDVPTDIKTGPDGYLYVLSHGSGQIHRILPRNQPRTTVRSTQRLQVVSSGEGYQEVFYNYSTGIRRISPYTTATTGVPYSLPKNQWVGVYHYDYAAGRFTQAVYQGSRIL